MVQQARPVTSPVQVQLIAVAVCFSNVIYAVVLVLLRLSSMPEGGFLGEDAPPTLLLGPVLLIAGVTLVAVSFLVRRAITPAVFRGGADLAAKTRLILISMAIADAAGVLGLVMGLVTGDLAWALTLCAVGLAGAILHFPTRVWLEEEV